jgi:putative phosphoesterase
VQAQRIGVIADTHDEIVSWDGVHERVRAAFDGVELVLHCGDLQTPAVLDRLTEIAPVLAVRSADDPPASPPRLVDGPRVVDARGTRVGVVCALEDGPSGDVEKIFGVPVSVVVFGGTHEALVERRGDVLFVNPGSPTLAAATSVAVLRLDGDEPEAEIVKL